MECCGREAHQPTTRIRVLVYLVAGFASPEAV
jgi:hypothetical protein